MWSKNHFTLALYASNSFFACNAVRLLEFLFGYRATCWLQCNSHTMYKLELVLLRPDAQSICTQRHAFHLHWDKMRTDWWFCFISAILELRRILSVCENRGLHQFPSYVGWSSILSHLFVRSQDSACAYMNGAFASLRIYQIKLQRKQNFKEADKSPVFH